MSEEQTPETIPEIADSEEDCLACDALEYFCDTIEDPEAKKKCMISTRAVQDGILDADKAREEIMGIIGEDKYQESVDKVNVWLGDKFKEVRAAMRESSPRDIDVSTDRHLLPEEKEVPEESIDKSDKILDDKL